MLVHEEDGTWRFDHELGPDCEAPGREATKAEALAYLQQYYPSEAERLQKAGEL